MNSDYSIDPRKALEASLTSLLLGELPEDQAHLLRQAIAADPELTKTYQTLQKTIQLLRETEAQPQAESSIHLEARKLSPERRAQLMQQFKTVHPPAFRASVPRRPAWLVPVAAAGALLIVLTSLLLPVLSKTKSRSIASVAPGEMEKQTRRLVESHTSLVSSAATDFRLGEPATDTIRLARSDNFGFQSPGVTPLASLPSPAQSAGTTRFQNKIVLPDDNKLALLTDRPGAVALKESDWNYYLQPSEERLAESETKLGDFQTFVVVGGRAKNQEPASVLGNAPSLGAMFQPEPKEELALRPPVSSGLSSEGIAWDKDLQQGETQQVTALYAGGSFGGFSSIVPLPGGQPSEAGAAGGAENVPPLKSELGRDAEKPALEGAVRAAKSPLIPELNSSSKSDAAKEVAQVVDTPKEKAESELLKRRLARVDQLDESLGKKSAGKSTTARGDRGRLEQEDLGASTPTPATVPQPEVQVAKNPFSTFSLNVSDVSFKLAGASLEKGLMPDPAGIRSEEFINAFEYRDPEPAPGVPVAFVWERAQYPFAQNRDLLRFSLKTAAVGRQTGRPLNLVLLLDNSGSMERADRVRILHEALRVLAAQLRDQDTFSVVTFARTARLWIDGVAGTQAGGIVEQLSALTPEGGTNLEEAMNLAYQTVLRHYAPNGINRIVLLTDGAANLGDTAPEVLKKKVDTNRKQGIALDCFGIGWEGYNDDLLEQLTRNGDGRYGFLNTPQEAASGFAAQLAGALHVAASDVKVQIEFNPNRTISYRQIGYARHQLTQEQFRDNTVAAAELGAAESGNALYVIETNPQGDGPVATVRVRFKLPTTGEYSEREWTVPYTGNANSLEQSSQAMRLAATASAFSEWLASSPYATEVTPDRLLSCLNGVPATFGADPRPQKLEWMIRQAKALSGK